MRIVTLGNLRRNVSIRYHTSYNMENYVACTAEWYSLTYGFCDGGIQISLSGYAAHTRVILIFIKTVHMYYIQHTVRLEKKMTVYKRPNSMVMDKTGKTDQRFRFQTNYIIFFDRYFVTSDVTTRTLRLLA
jgi:hypothetical protein